ncbi:MAG: RNase A-like domain-containing protein [Candidatus Dormibacteria bacterium]
MNVGDDVPLILGGSADGPGAARPDLTHVGAHRGIRVGRRSSIETGIPNLVTFDIPSLEFYEGVGGHTLRRHVGTTARHDVDRLEREPDIGAAGSFFDVDVADRAMREAIRDHASSVEKWLRAGAPGIFVAETYFQEQVGSVLTRAALNRGIETPAPATGARIVLRGADDLPGRFLVRTCYPVIQPCPTARLSALIPEPEARHQLLAPFLAPSPGSPPVTVDPGAPGGAWFLSADIAESAIDAALESWGDDIRRWVTVGGNEGYRAAHRHHDDIGVAAPAGASTPLRPTQKLRFVLHRQAQSAIGFTVAIAEPTITRSGAPLDPSADQS